jgi:hypothetical protein
MSELEKAKSKAKQLAILSDIAEAAKKRDDIKAREKLLESEI